MVVTFFSKIKGPYIIRGYIPKTLVSQRLSLHIADYMMVPGDGSAALTCSLPGVQTPTETPQQRAQDTGSQISDPKTLQISDLCSS